MSKRQKQLVVWSAGLMIIALAAQRIQMGHSVAIAVGLIEVLLAIATGIAFGLTVSRSDQ